jgi:hypothetical protein
LVASANSGKWLRPSPFPAPPLAAWITGETMRS